MRRLQRDYLRYGAGGERIGASAAAAISGRFPHRNGGVRKLDLRAARLTVSRPRGVAKPAHGFHGITIRACYDGWLAVSSGPTPVHHHRSHRVRIAVPV